MYRLTNRHEQLWHEEQQFEQDLRAIMEMMRPHRRERLKGWKEYRTGGPFFRVTVSWDEQWEDDPGTAARTAVPRMGDVLEALLIGSAYTDESTARQEFAAYRQIVRELNRRIDELEDCCG
jgi:hypothetical protein